MHSRYYGVSYGVPSFTKLLRLYYVYLTEISFLNDRNKILLDIYARLTV